MFQGPQSQVLALQEVDLNASNIYPIDGWKMQVQNMHSSAKDKDNRKKSHNHLRIYKLSRQTNIMFLRNKWFAWGMLDSIYALSLCMFKK